jgi:glycosyltransferase involved in cell wall biosynthesis
VSSVETARAGLVRIVRQPRRMLEGATIRTRTRRWADRSHLFVLGESLGWALDDEAAYIASTARSLGYAVGEPAWARHVGRQAVFHTSHFAALDPLWTSTSHALGLSYFHGRPGTHGFPEFDRALTALRRDPARFDRVQVTHAEMHELVVSAGVPEERVHRIPIGIELDRFPLGDAEARADARERLGVPATAFVVGSFQKDGVGWGEGLEPKAIKGPDVLVAALERVAAAVPDLFVLLTGPARGWVRRELGTRGIPHTHVLLDGRDGLPSAYHALDAYLVASRQEGGPKSILESMATGVPFVTTAVGQVTDLVQDGVNGLVAPVEDDEALGAAVLRVRDDGALVGALRVAGRATAEANAHAALVPRWAALLDGFAERESAR